MELKYRKAWYFIVQDIKEDERENDQIVCAHPHKTYEGALAEYFLTIDRRFYLEKNTSLHLRYSVVRGDFSCTRAISEVYFKRADGFNVVREVRHYDFYESLLGHKSISFNYE